MELQAHLALVCTLTFGTTLCLTSPLSAQSYEHAFQRPVGDRAVFNVAGTATGDTPDVQGDSFLTSVVYPSGKEFIFFYKPVNVHDVQYVGGERDHFRVVGGTQTKVGFQGKHTWGDADGDDDDVTADDVASFEADMRTVMGNTNLNNYIDLGNRHGEFSFIIEFDLVVKDNDPDADDFGEILYFERGAGNGNSWIKMQAVDESGNALGPWLVIGPNETVQTYPVTTVWRSDQKMGTTSIDVSRLGVTEFKYLRVSNDVTGEPAYTGGGDRNPDFKIMAVITNEEQLAAKMIYD